MNRATVVFAGLLLVATPLSLLAGRVWLDPASTPNASIILAELRLPRAMLAIVVGAGLRGAWRGGGWGKGTRTFVRIRLVVNINVGEEGSV